VKGSPSGESAQQGRPLRGLEWELGEPSVLGLASRLARGEIWKWPRRHTDERGSGVTLYSSVFIRGEIRMSASADSKWWRFDP